jgi:hypothetical protein
VKWGSNSLPSERGKLDEIIYLRFFSFKIHNSTHEVRRIARLEVSKPSVFPLPLPIPSSVCLSLFLSADPLRPLPHIS